MGPKYKSLKESDKLMLIFSTKVSEHGGSATVYALLKDIFLCNFTEDFPQIKKRPKAKHTNLKAAQ